MERRELIQWLVATGGGLQAVQAYALGDLLALGRDVHRRAAPAQLPPHAERTVAIAAERILPGATDAKVGAFIDKILADWYSDEERERFLHGLPELDTRAQARSQRGFIDSLPSDQDAVLTALDAELTALRARTGDEQANRHWFAMLKFLTIYGWCTSELGMRAQQLYPLPWRYDGCAPE